ncbi:MAG: hypothetical protein AAF943_08905 [Pseudomonadota bacterium]
MDEVDFSDESVISKRLKSLSAEHRSLLIGRALLRVLGEYARVREQGHDRHVLLSFRAVIICKVQAQGRFGDMITEASRVQDPACDAAASIRSSAEPLQISRKILLSSSEAAMGHLESRSAARALSLVETVSGRAILSKDLRASHQELLASTVWYEPHIPKLINENRKTFLEWLSSDHRWRFFHDWYVGMWDGTWSDWDLAHEVAKIDAKVWKAGLDAVAAEIEGIKKRLGRDLPRPDSVPELEREKLVEHVKQLLKNPGFTALAAEGAAETLSQAIKRYLDEAPANCLPDELAYLNDLPAVFREISEIVKSKERGEAQERRLLEEIERLNAKIARMEAEA